MNKGVEGFLDNLPKKESNMSELEDNYINQIKQSAIRQKKKGASKQTVYNYLRQNNVDLVSAELVVNELFLEDQS